MVETIGRAGRRLWPSAGVLILAALVTGVALADGEDGATTVAYEGFLAGPDGAPLDGTVPMAFDFFPDAAGNGAALCSWTHGMVAVHGGRFRVALGSTGGGASGTCADLADLLASNEAVWMRITLTPPGEDPQALDPLIPIAAVPRALHARTADGLSAAGRIALVPPGTVMPFAGRAIPPGWLACDGSDVSAAEHPDLCAALGDTFGSGPAGTCRLPDLQGRFLVGEGEDEILGDRGGRATLPNHSHEFALTAAGQTFDGDAPSVSNEAHTHSASTVTGTVGGSDGTHTHTDAGHLHDVLVGYNAGAGNSIISAHSTDHATRFGAPDVGVGYADITDIGSGHGHAFSLTAAGQAGGAHRHTVSLDHTHAASSVTGTVGSGPRTEGADSRPPFVVVRYIIKD